MPAYSVWTLREYSTKTSPCTIYTGDITVVSLPGFLTEFGQMRTAIEGITRGIVAKEKWVGDDSLLSNASPTDPNAQREQKWLVRYRDTVTEEKFSLEVPTADPGTEAASRLTPGTDFANLANTEIAAFVTRFESFGRSPRGNAVQVLNIELVGRNV